jgi:hypothetical protein
MNRPSRGRFPEWPKVFLDTAEIIVRMGCFFLKCADVPGSG